MNTPGTGLERVRATAVSQSGREYSDLSDANGVFRIEGVAEGIYKVRFTDPAEEYLTEWFNDKADQATADPLVVNGDATVAGIDLPWPPTRLRSSTPPPSTSAAPSPTRPARPSSAPG